MNEWKGESDDKIRSLQSLVARNGRQIACMKPLLCGRENCENRVLMSIEPEGKPTSIEPINATDI
jgi:hypothetical protein